jgi:Bifunctional DNA primase/polymerase, N-terminal/Primase C terminal 2 (PriCT-2)
VTEGRSHILQVRSRFAAAVQAAIEAYARTGHMLDAALAYAEHGIPVFPLSARSKAPIPKRNKDGQGIEIPRTGGLYKATCDLAIIHQWWDYTENLIGVPMGPRSGVWCVDVDTNLDHAADGIAAWQALLAEHGNINTRTHITASGGLHVLLIYPDDQHIGCKRGSIPKGVEIKGAGGYIVMPPSKRKGRCYTNGKDIDPIRAPTWLIDIITTRAPLLDVEHKTTGFVRPLACDTETEKKPGNAHLVFDHLPADLIDLASAVAAIPNDNVPWDLWTEMALAIYAATQGRGFAIFNAWSAKSWKYNPSTTGQRWQEIYGSPPDRFGARGRYIHNLAQAHGGLPRTAPTYPEATFNDLIAAREKVRQVACEFLTLDERPKNAFELLADANDAEPTPSVWAMRIDTGVGKTRIVVDEIAKSGKRGIVYAVPTHKLGDDIERQFADHGVVARAFRGRSADDPERPGAQMCLNMPAVEVALKCHADISKSCCEYKKRYCRFISQCGYQRQMLPRPQVWIIAADMIFHHQAAFGKLQALIIDESFWQKSLRGIEHIEEWSVPLASMMAGSQSRRDLAVKLSMQSDDGGLQRQIVDQMDAADLSRFIRLEWAAMPKIRLYPGMPQDEFDRLQKDSRNVDKIALARRVIRIVEELRHIVVHPDIQVSWRLLLDHDSNELRIIRWRGVDTITKQFRIPTLLLDATLPDLSVLQVLHPQAEIVADIRVAMPPSVHIRQLLDSPTSSRKLVATRLKDPEQHLKAVRGYVIQRWYETGRQPTLVICQMKVAEWLNNKLPDGITVAHFNAIAGLDNFKNVRLLILVGRTQPGPGAVEVLAGTLSGSEPMTKAAGGQGFAWYQQVRRGIRLRDGTGVAVDGDQHPDAFAESVRQLITEAELVQALGRGRAVNRTEKTPLDVDLLFDTCLPVTVDVVANWTEPSLLIETAAEGVMLTSPVDMVRIWPTIWPNDKAADRTLAKGIPALPGFRQFSYQLDGPKMKPRIAYFSLDLIPNPRVWLEARLGPLSKLSL